MIGGDDTPEARKAVDKLGRLYGKWVPESRIITADVWSSELSKLASNAMLAQRVSSVNSLAALCEFSGANVVDVSKAVGMDRRIGPRFLEAGVGFGGSCFTKDILNLVYLCRHYGLEDEAEYWHQVVKMNAHQRERFVKRIVSAMFNTLAGKRIAIFGLAFKPDTGDTRDSPAINIAEGLVREQAEVVIHDPKAAAVIPGVSFAGTPYEAVAGAHAVLLLTGWKEYADLDYQRIFDSMQKPAFLFDGRNFLIDHRRLHMIGFNVYPVGKPALEHF
jgi:UDPglucose 6-dehydrogenase